MVSIVGLFALLCCSSGVPGGHVALTTQVEQRASHKKDEPICWPNRGELVTSDASPRRLPKLPKRLMQRQVKQFSVTLKVCISENGDVARTLILRSSGDKQVDAFFQAATTKWRFKPMQQQGKAVPSILRVSTVWNPQ